MPENRIYYIGIKQENGRFELQKESHFKGEAMREFTPLVERYGRDNVILVGSVAYKITVTVDINEEYYS